ncbi:MAG TPA: Holliday junction resolvase RuvX [Candidatus Saccharimonadales bacterium]|nr:Holliday junction resolvase RuvX [Candidatus Saccharimonadales bacterium]
MATSSLLALDVGAVRVGVAIASLEAQLPRPLITLDRNDTLFPTLQSIIEVESVKRLIVGFPRGMQGQHTAQTNAIEEFVTELKQHFALPVELQDEALTSKHAEDELRARGKPYDKGDIDSLAATYILEDFLQSVREKAKAAKA